MDVLIAQAAEGGESFGGLMKTLGLIAAGATGVSLFIFWPAYQWFAGLELLGTPERTEDVEDQP